MKPSPAMTAVRLIACGSAAFRAVVWHIWPVAVSWFVLASVAGRLCAGQEAARPAEGLLRLVPPDAVAVLTVEGLRDHARAFQASRLFAELLKLPTVTAWLDSEKYRRFERSRAGIEALLGANLTSVRDELIGDAAVLALRLGPDAPNDPSQARGLLLFQARDHELLERLIRVVNSSQKQSGELARVADRTRAGTTYHVREFADAARIPEWYVAYADGTFAFSNSESLIQAVIDRKPPAPAAGAAADAAVPTSDGGLGGLARFKEVQKNLPERALARLFVDPRTFERLMAASPRPGKPTDANVLAQIERYVAAVRYAGAALVWSDESIVVHTVETLDPSKLEPWIVRWAGDARPAATANRRLPATALALVAGHVDLLAVYEAISRIVPAEDQSKLTNLSAILAGVLMGQDLRTKVLPKLGPGIYAYFDTPPADDKVPSGGAPAPSRSSWRFPTVLVIPIVDERAAGAPLIAPEPYQPAPVPVADALENALHTALALTAMDEKRNQGRSRIVTQTVAGRTVTTLDPPIPFAYTIDRAGSRLILSNSARAVARELEAAQEESAADRFRKLQAAAFLGDQTFVCVDLDRLGKLAATHRDRLVHNLSASKGRPVVEVERDLAQALALSGLFDAAFATSRLDPQATIVYRSAGLILRDQQPAASAGKP